MVTDQNKKYVTPVSKRVKDKKAHRGALLLKKIKEGKLCGIKILPACHTYKYFMYMYYVHKCIVDLWCFLSQLELGRSTVNIYSLLGVNLYCICGSIDFRNT